MLCKETARISLLLVFVVCMFDTTKPYRHAFAVPHPHINTMLPMLPAGSTGPTTTPSPSVVFAGPGAHSATNLPLNTDAFSEISLDNNHYDSTNATSAASFAPSSHPAPTDPHHGGYPGATIAALNQLPFVASTVFNSFSNIISGITKEPAPSSSTFAASVPLQSAPPPPPTFGTLSTPADASTAYNSPPEQPFYPQPPATSIPTALAAAPAAAAVAPPPRLYSPHDAAAASAELSRRPSLPPPSIGQQSSANTYRITQKRKTYAPLPGLQTTANIANPAEIPAPIQAPIGAAHPPAPALPGVQPAPFSLPYEVQAPLMQQQQQQQQPESTAFSFSALINKVPLLDKFKELTVAPSNAYQTPDIAPYSVSSAAFEPQPPQQLEFAPQSTTPFNPNPQEFHISSHFAPNPAPPQAGALPQYLPLQPTNIQPPNVPNFFSDPTSNAPPLPTPTAANPTPPPPRKTSTTFDNSFASAPPPFVQQQAPPLPPSGGAAAPKPTSGYRLRGKPLYKSPNTYGTVAPAALFQPTQQPLSTTAPLVTQLYNPLESSGVPITISYVSATTTATPRSQFVATPGANAADNIAPPAFVSTVQTNTTTTAADAAAFHLTTTTHVAAEPPTAAPTSLPSVRCPANVPTPSAPTLFPASNDSNPPPSSINFFNPAQTLPQPSQSPLAHQPIIASSASDFFNTPAQPAPQNAAPLQSFYHVPTVNSAPPTIFNPSNPQAVDGPVFAVQNPVTFDETAAFIPALTPSAAAAIQPPPANDETWVPAPVFVAPAYPVQHPVTFDEPAAIGPDATPSPAAIEPPAANNEPWATAPPPAEYFSQQAAATVSSAPEIAVPAVETPAAAHFDSHIPLGQQTLSSFIQPENTAETVLLPNVDLTDSSAAVRESDDITTPTSIASTERPIDSATAFFQTATPAAVAASAQTNLLASFFDSPAAVTSSTATSRTSSTANWFNPIPVVASEASAASSAWPPSTQQAPTTTLLHQPVAIVRPQPTDPNSFFQNLSTAAPSPNNNNNNTVSASPLAAVPAITSALDIVNNSQIANFFNNPPPLPDDATQQQLDLVKDCNRNFQATIVQQHNDGGGGSSSGCDAFLLNADRNGNDNNVGNHIDALAATDSNDAAPAERRPSAVVTATSREFFGIETRSFASSNAVEPATSIRSEQSEYAGSIVGSQQSASVDHTPVAEVCFVWLGWFDPF